jgi:hypothetical protein
MEGPLSLEIEVPVVVVMRIALPTALHDSEAHDFAESEAERRLRAVSGVQSASVVSPATLSKVVQHR